MKHIMNKRRWIFGFFCAICTISMAQTRTLYRIYLTDKAHNEYTVSQPQDFLSERAIARRAGQNISIDETDLPVSRFYLQQIEALGGTIVTTGKWLNTAIVSGKDEQFAERLAALPFVKSIREVGEQKPSDNTSKTSNVKSQAERKKEYAKESDTYMEMTQRGDLTDVYYGHGAHQIESLHGDTLHALGYKGENMYIAIMDGGFYNADIIEFFQRTKIRGTKDFTGQYHNVYGSNKHGMQVLSCMGTNVPYKLVGTAPEAEYWLFTTEVNETEQLVEEDYWVSAIEYADSLGIDVVNTSLGYCRFDNACQNYNYKDLDGKQSVMSAAADKAVEKGILVVCSAGNSGLGRWKKITTPADAFHVLAVGAVDKEGHNTNFSSIGNTSDNRIKPDVMALGAETAVITTHGNVGNNNGTSFAAPILCGLATCLWQACPWLTALEVTEIIRLSGSEAEYPNNIMGYGIPDFRKAYELALQRKQP